VISVRQGELYLIGKVRVALITSQDAAASLLGDDPAELWEADEHILASAATPMRFARKVSSAMTQRLRFKRGSLEVPLKFTASGLLDQQTLRGVRELTLDAAAALDTLLEELQEINFDQPNQTDNDAVPVSTAEDDRQSTADPAELDRRVACLLARGPIPRPTGQATPREIRADSVSFLRDPAVKAWVLQQAQGRCELCGLPGPFQLPSGALYLEVHHVHPLANGGPDFIENAVALCPNCHSRLHLSADADAQREALYAKVRRLVR
jgi:hypothetical protein